MSRIIAACRGNVDIAVAISASSGMRVTSTTSGVGPVAAADAVSAADAIVLADAELTAPGYHAQTICLMQGVFKDVLNDLCDN